MSIDSKIENILTDYNQISLEEIEKASLMRRKDNKYVFSVGKLPLLLEAAKEHYSVLEIEKRRAHSYQTTYYDTPGLEMYAMHHNGRVNRHKVRVRKYGTSDLAFLEVKKKDAKGVTMKNRVKTGKEDGMVLTTEEAFLSQYIPYDHAQMSPVLENMFKRITLVSHDQKERITLDYQLWFSSRISEDSLDVPGISIAEIKYGGMLNGSAFHTALRSAGIVPRRFSKYCMGMAMLNPGLKQNLFKQKLRYINKINLAYLQDQTDQNYA